VGRDLGFVYYNEMHSIAADVDASLLKATSGTTILLGDS
jgi:hypothetical protein